MATKKTRYNKTGIENLPDNKPAVYKILTAAGKANYVGVAKRGRIQERISEHLGEIPGATVQIQQTDSIAVARKKEAKIIKRSKPRYNKQARSAKPFHAVSGASATKIRKSLGIKSEDVKAARKAIDKRREKNKTTRKK